MAGLQRCKSLSSECIDEDLTDTKDCLSTSSVLLDRDVYWKMVEELNDDMEVDADGGFCICWVCRARRNTSVNQKTKYYVEFQLHCLKAQDVQLPIDLVDQCRAANVAGYVVFTYDREHASGIMEGGIRSINTVKDWLETPGSRIPEPHDENIYFSWFLVARNPFDQPFEQYFNSNIGLTE